MKAPKKVNYPFTLFSIAFVLLVHSAKAQDPKLPPTNLGISNMQDGNPPPVSGWTFQEVLQLYQSNTNKDANGNKFDGPKISSLLAMSQLIYNSNTKVVGGKLGFTVLVPVVKISAINNSGPVPIVNPNSLGDVITGTFVQWSNKRLFNMRFSHRLEVDVVLPVGAYQQQYAINPSSHLFTILPHYTFTIFPTDKFSISMRHHFNYNFDEIGTNIKPGMFYNFNYSIEYAVARALRVEIAGYYLTQLNQDSKDGDSYYFQQQYHISDTRERVFAYGPGISYVTPSGLSLELKGMQETAAKNRTEGVRSTLVLTYMLDKH